ncbi:MAG TPA: thiamine phosphate synthase [Bacteroidia bacterium]|nr:thiamine phosphate synthase [Bacteroidia bacterium]
MTNLPRLQYISQGNTFDEQYQNIYSALDAGVKWIQLRWKNADLKVLFQIAENVSLLCGKYNSIFIINDYPEIAAKLNCNGVHLGLNDMSVHEARKILKPQQWIGGTANTLNDVLQRIEEKVTYIGLGPYRFTTTKEKLSPILGLEGYKNILSNIKTDIPIYAIGGITEEDIMPLMETGIYGVAISSAITNAKDKSKYIHQLNQLLYGAIKNC